MVTGFAPFWHRDPKRQYELIRKVEYKMPGYFSPQLKDLISKLLVKNPASRLGAKSFDDIKNHEFFDGINWDLLLKKQLKPPIVATQGNDATPTNNRPNAAVPHPGFSVSLFFFPFILLETQLESSNNMKEETKSNYLPDWSYIDIGNTLSSKKNIH